MDRRVSRFLTHFIPCIPCLMLCDDIYCYLKNIFTLILQQFAFIQLLLLNESETNKLTEWQFSILKSNNVIIN